MTEKTTTTTEPKSEPDAAPPFETITLTSQDELNDFIGGRLDKARASEAKKYPNYDTLKAKAAELDSIKQASMTQQEKDAARIGELEATLANLHRTNEVVALRRAVADSKKVDENLLAGETLEELEAHADKLLAWRGAAESKPRVPPVGIGRSGASNTDPRMDKKERAAAMLREFYGSGRH